ncbi:MAG TPA: glycosyltransferase [Bacteroidales bacterium]|nr:glycosyltransferase [Bacteroidales bacterium]
MEAIDLFIERPALVVPLLLLLSFVVQMIYYLGVYTSILTYKGKATKPQPISPPPVSVIICAKDEEANLEKNLPAVLNQDYPDYEVIVVNHGSSDDTDMVLKRLQQQHEHLKTTEIKRDQKFAHGKKLALTVGIKKAAHEWLLFTDADCYPTSKNWIRSMARNFDEKTSVVLGYGGYEARRGFLNSLIRFDTLTIALQYFAYALRGFPYMGVGRNLAYRKSLYFQNKGFAGHYHIESGDDDLFVNQTAGKANTRVQISRDSVVLSEPHHTFINWFKQKSRHLTTAPFYKGKTRLRLLTEVISRLVFYVAFVLALVLFPRYYTYILGVFIIRLIAQLLDYKGIMNRVGEKKLLFVVLFYDILIPFINFMGIIKNKIASNNHQWK